MTAGFLTDADVERLTGYRQPAAQVRLGGMRAFRGRMLIGRKNQCANV